MTDNKNVGENPGQTIIINQEQKQTNGIGIAGFILAILGLFLGWIPFLGWLIWFLGLIFSFIGLFKNPKGLSIAGLIISFIGIFFLMLMFFGFLGLSGIPR